MPTPTPFATAIFNGSIGYGNVLEFSSLACFGGLLMLFGITWLVTDFLLKRRNAQ